MGSNTFGTLFKVMTWGESHGKAIGAVIDGCPAGLPLNESDLHTDLARRSPGNSPFTSPRKEEDHAEILSGVFEGKTTGAPISIIIPNQDADSTKYDAIKELLRPGHANFTYRQKYGVFDHRGGGRASARETACRVAAGAVARKLLTHYGIDIVGYVKAIGEIQAGVIEQELPSLRQKVYSSPLYCPDEQATALMMQTLQEIKESGDSLGGVVEVVAAPLPVGLGDPIYEKLEANIARAMMSLPASKGVEIGSGFQSARMKGSEHNDLFISREGEIRTETNTAGGILGGISNGMPLVVRVAFKPASSIMKSQPTVDWKGNPETFQLPSGSRHDPCVAIRAVPVVEAMLALVLADAFLMNRCSRLSF